MDWWSRLGVGSKRLLMALALVLLAAAVFAQVAGFKFISYDDQAYVFKNMVVRQGLTWQGIHWAFSSTLMHFYAPITTLSHMVDCQLFGLDPGAHHLMSLGFHLANVLLLFVLMQALTGRPWRSWFVAALFAIHPMHVEAVTWIAERKELLSALFGFACLLAYARYARRPSIMRQALVGLLLLGALLTKPMLVTLPCLMLLLDVWPLGRLPWPPLGGVSVSEEPGAWKRWWTSLRPLVMEKVPLFALVLIFSLTTYWLNASGGTLNLSTVLPFHLRLANALYAYGQYLSKFFMPVGLSVFYPHPGREMPWALVAASGLLLLLVTLAVLRLGRRRPYLAVGWFWFAGTLVPVLGLIQVGSMQSYADRYTYFAYTGLFVALVWVVADWAGSSVRRRVSAAALGALILSALAFQAHAYASCWKDTETLFLHARAVAGKPNFMIEAQMGLIRYWAHGDIPGAKALLKNALSLNPGAWSNWGAMGFIFSEEGKLPEAEACFRMAVKAGGDKDYDTVQNLGKCLFSQGKYAEAEPFLVEAQKLAPEAEAPRRLLVDSLMRRGRYAEAEVILRSALASDPDNLGSRVQRAACEAAQGRGADAEALLQKALHYGGNNPRAQMALIYALLECPETPKPLLAKVEILAEAVSAQLGSEDREALDYLIWAKERNGKLEEAARLKDQARQIPPPVQAGKARTSMF